MKSQITSLNKGFLMSEVMIAFSLMTLFLTSAIVLSSSSLRFSVLAQEKLDRLEWLSENIASTTLFTYVPYGNDSIISHLEPITRVTSDYLSAWGRGTCDPRMQGGATNFSLLPGALSIGSGNSSTDLEVRHGFVYLTADSSSSSLHDIYIIDFRDPAAPSVLSSLTTGPGLSAVEVAGPYLYVANLGTTNQLQVIDISDRSAPVVVSRFKLPLPRASSTPPLATSLFYYKERIYLGTEKWEGSELSVLDVSTPYNPVYLGGFEVGTQVNDIYVRDGVAYVAASDIGQKRVLDVSDPAHITQISEFSPSGWETQQGKKLSYFEGMVSLGRTTGGFNVTSNHELFSFATCTAPMVSKDIPGGVYGIVGQPEHTLIATRYPGQELQVWRQNLTEKMSTLSLGFSPEALACDESTLYFATGDSRGVGVVTTNTP